MFVRTLAAFVVLFSLTACDGTQTLETLRNTPPADNADPYRKALATDYKAYAEELAADYDWGLTRYFAEKGLDVINNKEVGPEDPAIWNFGNPPLDELKEARERLLKAIATGKSTQPEVTASAVVAYDRLLVLHHFDSDKDKIDEQQQAYTALLTKLEEAHTASNIADIPPPSVPSEVNRTVLYFPFDSAKLGDSALSALAELARAIPAADDVNVTINGHADRAGTENYNMKLSERRAIYVEKSLEKLGVAKKRMQHYAFGETDPAVPTEDGVKEPKNRRVEVIVE